MGVHQTNVQNDTQQQQQIVVVDGREGELASIRACVAEEVEVQSCSHFISVGFGAAVRDFSDKHVWGSRGKEWAENRDKLSWRGNIIVRDSHTGCCCR